MRITQSIILYCNLFVFSQAIAQTKNETPAKTDQAQTILPQIPRNTLSTTDAMRIREELEFIRQDVENKIMRLEEAKVTYEKSKSDIDLDLKKIQEERKILDETLLKEKKIKADRLAETTAFIAKMEPKKAAPVLETMDQDLVMAIFSSLDKKQVTKLLEAMNPAKATLLLERFSRIRSGREYEMLKELGLCQDDKDNYGTKSQSQNEKQPTRAEVPKTEPQTQAPQQQTQAKNK